ncbi:MAG: DUF998 domain-containing protein [Promethearchaeota archaeon]
MGKKKESKMEVYFGLGGVLFIIIFLPITALLTPDYTPLENTVSSLGGREMKSLFSICFVITGSLLIPFYIYLERELVNIKDNIRRLATGVSIFTCVCIALVGIIPDETYWDFFVGFHGFVAVVSFVGSSIYIVLYSILMYYVPKAKMYQGPRFKKYLAFYGFFIGFFLIILLVTLNPLIEWILTTMICFWILITQIQCIKYKFFDIPGLYYKRSQFPEALKLFEDSIEILERLNISDDPIADTLKENIEFLKNRWKKKHS